jgi:hypothetical protein
MIPIDNIKYEIIEYAFGMASIIRELFVLNKEIYEFIKKRFTKLLKISLYRIIKTETYEILDYYNPNFTIIKINNYRSFHYKKIFHGYNYTIFNFFYVIEDNFKIELCGLNYDLAIYNNEEYILFYDLKIEKTYIIKKIFKLLIVNYKRKYINDDTFIDAENFMINNKNAYPKEYINGIIKNVKLDEKNNEKIILDSKYLSIICL